MTRVLVTRTLPETWLAPLRAAFGEESVVELPGDQAAKPEALRAGVPGAHGIFSFVSDPITEELMDLAGPQLACVSNMAVGYDNIDVQAATARGIAVTNTPGVLSEATADLAWTLILAAARRAGESERYLRAGQWTSWSATRFLGVDLCGKTLGIFGMGRIGQAVARRAQGFRMPVLYHNRTRLPEETERALNATHVDKATLLSRSDFLSINCPLTEETYHAFDHAAFAAMKPGAILINTARGAVVDEAALVDALESGQLRAAGLDVYEKEPTVHPGLLTCENAVLIPHLGSASEETRCRMAHMTCENLVARLTGQTPPHCINPASLS